MLAGPDAHLTLPIAHASSLDLEEQLLETQLVDWHTNPWVLRVESPQTPSNSRKCQLFIKGPLGAPVVSEILKIAQSE